MTHMTRRSTTSKALSRHEALDGGHAFMVSTRKEWLSAPAHLGPVILPEKAGEAPSTRWRGERATATEEVSVLKRRKTAATDTSDSMKTRGRRRRGAPDLFHLQAGEDVTTFRLSKNSWGGEDLL
jgi:hypothetical protein